ncbi:MAG TPA: hypothetical protein VF713_17545, partial [Thermoanaerobaculia bacterium]
GPGLASAGQMKISPDGTMIAAAGATNFVEIWQFNTSTGQVTPPSKQIMATASDRTNACLVNGVTYCCDVTPTTTKFCCSKACPPGSIETTTNGVKYCCTVDPKTGELCCTRQ